MGQTLTHGIYLPDEGERNCYDGLASNWSILDGAVGTIAEHTTALAGKAPLVHTHTKSNITDLFNSANTWSGDNTYSNTVAIERSTDTGNFLALKNTVAELGSTPASATPVTIAYRDKNNDNLSYMGVYYDTDGSNHFRLYVRNKFASGAPSTSGINDYTTFQLRLNADKSKEGILRASFRPYDSNTYDLGSSAYQWNNLYAKNYYYNGVAWGLDKANVWSAIQTISYAGSNVAIVLKNQETDIAASSTRNNWHYINFYDKNSVALGGFNYSKRTNGNSRVYLNLRTKNTNNDIVEKNIYFETNQEGTVWNLYPAPNADINLGTSTNKWATLNGINPGALSLPVLSRWVNIDTTNWNKTGADNSYTPTIDGWILLRLNNVTGNYIFVANSACSLYSNATGSGSSWFDCFVPVRKDVALTIQIKGTNLVVARFYPAEGNV